MIKAYFRLAHQYKQTGRFRTITDAIADFKHNEHDGYCLLMTEGHEDINTKQIVDLLYERHSDQLIYYID